MLLIVVCVAYVISDVSTHRLPIVYYEGYFTYLYGASILFLLYVFCFLLQGKSYYSFPQLSYRQKKNRKKNSTEFLHFKKNKKNVFGTANVWILIPQTAKRIFPMKTKQPTFLSYADF